VNRVYISDDGEDQNDGGSPETAVYSWKRAAKLCDGNSEVDVHEASASRLRQEIARRTGGDRALEASDI
jgi:hypothetical protein